MVASQLNQQITVFVGDKPQRRKGRTPDFGRGKKKKKKR